MKADFADLPVHADPAVRAWCAHHMVEVMTFQSEHNKRALQEITARSSYDHGVKLWLKMWFDKHPNDRSSV